MITTGTKFFFGVSVFGLIAAVVYGLATGGDVLGVVSLGMYTGVGEHVGYASLVTLAVGGAFLGVMSIVFRDGDPETGPTAAEAEEIAAGPQASPSPWPVAGAFGIGLLMLGIVTSWPFFIAGIGVLAITLIEWMVQAWSDRATGDPAYNRGLRNQVMLPLEIPAGAAIGIGIAVLALSRVLLAVPAMGAVVVAIVVATVILGIAILMAWRPQVGAGVVSTVLVIGAVGVIGSGIVAAAVGERDFEAHGEHVEPEGEILELVAEDVEFEPVELSAKAGEVFTIQLRNEDEDIEHNVHVEGVEHGATDVEAGPVLQNLVLTIEEPGTFEYMCDVHPENMKGELTVTGQQAP